MTKTAWVLAVGLSACGPQVSGRVSGYELDVNEALFATVDDGKGAMVGAVVVLTDQVGTCASLLGTKAPPNAMYTTFTLTRQADGKLLSPDVGDYVLGATTTAAAAATGVFIRTDGNGTNAIPSANRGALSGLVRVTGLSLDRGTMNLSVDAKFGVQGDAIAGSLRASRCIIDTPSLTRGFLFAGGPGPQGAGVSQSADCADFVACYTATQTSPSNIDAYRSNGSCWSSGQATADACTSACRTALTSLRASPYAPAVCLQ
ncbi:MAG: hypothetical protein JNK82_07350 [Myxococcaceae bacterium]|nr:hypothetical protein [Myxococcaceae bacterium]